MLTQAELKSLFHYSPDTGIFTRIKTTSANAKAGTVAGCKDTYGRFVIRINNVLHYAHRLAWLYMTGDFPKELIDHIDCNNGNNKWSNLRCANKSTNAQNVIKAPKNNTTGFLGVSYHKLANKFRATICIDGKSSHLGLFESAEEAHQAYVEAKRKLHPYGMI